MLQKKICLLGAFGVGKTSLVRRFVDTIFSDAYLTTVGVKIDKKASRSMWRPIESRRQASSRVMRSVCAPVMAARAELVDSSMRSAAALA